MAKLTKNDCTTDQNERASFEEAVCATKFGKFNYLLILCSISGGMTPIIDNTVMSYVIPAAECDLDLSLQQKGTLNSAVFIGFLISSYFWGFLGDTLGRNRILFIAYFLDLIFNVLGAFMQNFWLQYIFKFLVGFVVSGPYALIITYMSEFHSSEYRSKVVLMIGISMGMSLVTLPALAWVIMPLSDFQISTYVFHSWQLFMLIASIPVLISTIVFAFLPESPKFLMTTGKNDEAMKIFRKIYSWNTGNPEENYPIKELYDETQSSDTDHVNENLNLESLSKQSILKILQSGLMQCKSLFHSPHLLNIFLTTTIHFGILLGANTLRLWMPQMFTTIDEYNQVHGTDTGTLCEVIEYSFSKNNTKLNSTAIADSECVVVLPNNQVYINSLIVSAGCVLGYIVLITLINHCPKKYLLVSMVTVSGFTTMGMYWTPDQQFMLIISAVTIVLAVISSPVIMSLVVELFPTSLRGVAVSLTLMAGQLGGLLGNLIFPYLLQTGCFPPFLFVGCIVVACGVLCLTLPNPSGKDFK